MENLRTTEEVSIVEARRIMTQLPEKLASKPVRVAVTRRGKPVLAILSWEDYESIMETLEIMYDTDAVQDLRQSIRELKEGAIIPWAEAKSKLQPKE